MRKAALFLPLAALMVVALTAVVDPAGEFGRYFPKCPFLTYTGYACPGCGTSRAVHALCSGRLADALSYNYFLPCVMLLLLSSIAVELWPTRLCRLRHVVLSPVVLYGFVTLTIAWWIIRNILGL